MPDRTAGDAHKRIDYLLTQTARVCACILTPNALCAHGAWAFGPRAAPRPAFVSRQFLLLVILKKRGRGNPVWCDQGGEGESPCGMKRGGRAHPLWNVKGGRIPAQDARVQPRRAPLRHTAHLHASRVKKTHKLPGSRDPRSDGSDTDPYFSDRMDPSDRSIRCIDRSVERPPDGCAARVWAWAGAAPRPAR